MARSPGRPDPISHYAPTEFAVHHLEPGFGKERLEALAVELGDMVCVGVDQAPAAGDPDVVQRVGVEVGDLDIDAAEVERREEFSRPVNMFEDMRQDQDVVAVQIVPPVAVNQGELRIVFAAPLDRRSVRP